MSAKPFGLAVKTIIWDPDGRCLLLKRPPDKHFGNQWDLPGGKADPGETLDEAIAREGAEETAITFTVDRFLGADEHEMEKVRVILLFFEGRWQSGDVRVRPGEHTEFTWASRADLLTMAISDQLRPFLERHFKADAPASE